MKMAERMKTVPKIKMTPQMKTAIKDKLCAKLHKT